MIWYFFKLNYLSQISYPHTEKISHFRNFNVKWPENCVVEKKSESNSVSRKNFLSRLCTVFKLFLKRNFHLMASVISVSLNNTSLVSFNSISDSAISLQSGGKVRGWRITSLPIFVHWLTTLDIEHSLFTFITLFKMLTPLYFHI